MADETKLPEEPESPEGVATETLLLIPLDDTVVFPTMSVTLPVEVGDDEKVLLVPRSDGEYAGVGTIATVTDRLRLPGGAAGVQLDAEMRGIAGAAHTDPMGQLRVETTPSPDDSPVDGRTRELVREYRAIVEPGALADTSGFAPDLTFEQKVKVLETLDVTERLELVIELQRERLAELQVRRKSREDVEEGAAKQQREYVLRQQM